MPMQSRLVALAAAVLLSASAAHAQQGAKKSAAPSAPAAQPAPAPTQPQADGAAAQQAGWVVRCTSVSRDAPLECAMEQNAVLTKTGQTSPDQYPHRARHPHTGGAASIAAWPQPPHRRQAPGRRGQDGRSPDPDLREPRLLRL